MDFVLYDPVKHGLAERPGDWPFSTFLTWVDLGRYADDWGGEAPVWPFPVGQE